MVLLSRTKLGGAWLSVCSRIPRQVWNIPGKKNRRTWQSINIRALDVMDCLPVNNSLMMIKWTLSNVCHMYMYVYNPPPTRLLGGGGVNAIRGQSGQIYSQPQLATRHPASGSAWTLDGKVAVATVTADVTAHRFCPLNLHLSLIPCVFSKFYVTIFLLFFLARY